MIEYLLRRIFQALLVMLSMSAIVFVGINAVGNPADLLISPDATIADRQAAIEALGLDRPLYEQYFIFLKNALSGNFGESYFYNQSAFGVILGRMPATLEIAFGATLIGVLLGVPLGLYSGLRPKSVASKAIMAASIVAFSLPTFWVGLLLIMVFSVQLGWLPSGGRGETIELLGMRWSFLTLNGLQHMILPSFNMALFQIGMLIRLTRTGVQESSMMAYVKFARAKGVSERRIVGVHIFKNILIPIVTVVGLNFGTLLAFAVVTETIFAWPGMGKLIVDSINILDRPVIVAYLMMIVLTFVVINLVVDLGYSLLDPRVRMGRVE